MSFLYPTYLWALLGLVIPIAIHLWSKRKVKTIKVGSTKFIQELEPQQTRSPKINEWWLLLLRLLSILLLTLILAQPYWKISEKNSALTYIVEPSLLNKKGIKTILDSIPNASILLLVPGFPEIQNHNVTVTDALTEVPNYWQLAKEMEALPTDSIVVLTNAFASGLKGMRPVIGTNINWKVMNPKETTEEAVEARSKGDKIELLSVVSDQQHLTFKKESLAATSNRIEVGVDSVKVLSNTSSSWLPLQVEDTIRIGVIYTDDLVREQEYIMAAFRAISRYLDRPVEVKTTKEIDSLNVSSIDCLVWLNASEAPNSKRPLLVFRPDSLASDLIEPGPEQDVFHLTKSLNTANIIEEQLAEQLVKLLPLHNNLDKKVATYDKRALDVRALEHTLSETSRGLNYANRVELAHWIWLVLGVVLIAERIISKYRRQ